MKNFFRLLLLALFTIGAALSHADQLSPEAVVIEINDGILKVNGHLIDMPSNIEAWIEALKPYSRGGENVIWDRYLWDEYGIRLLVNENSQIDNIVIYFHELPGNRPMTEDELLPHHCFSGAFFLNGIKLDNSLSLDDYNKIAAKHQYQFKEGYVSTLYKLPGYRLPNSDYVFTASARIDKELYPFNIELGYHNVPLQKTNPDNKSDSNRTEELVESLKKDGNDLVDRAMKLLDMECEDK